MEKEIEKKAIEYIKRQKQNNLDWLNKFREGQIAEEDSFKELEEHMLKEDKMFSYILKKLKEV